MGKHVTPARANEVNARERRREREGVNCSQSPIFPQGHRDRASTVTGGHLGFKRLEGVVVGVYRDGGGE